MAKILLVFTISILPVVLCDHLKVRTQNGWVQGALDLTRSNRTFYSFTGIPYAKPPIGSLRFEVPVPVTSWSGTLDATKPDEKCVQFFPINNVDIVVGSEDCLYLNVYTPQLSNNGTKLLPVMFYIHGGGFMEGSAQKELWGPNLLLEKNIVLVMSNYRLGPFGFLSTNDSAQPGNLGLKDQALALQWIKRNVENFGGDPNKITVFGQSAGGFNAHSFMFSPLTRDSIKGVIAQSGNAFNPFGMLPSSVALNRTKYLAESLGCLGDTTDVIRCLKNLPTVSFMLPVKTLLEERIGDAALFRPVLEPCHNGAFLCKSPMDMLKSGEVADVPFISGSTSDDGLILSGPILSNTTLTDLYNKNFDDLIPILLFYADITSDAEQKHLNKCLKEFYLRRNAIGNSTAKEFTNMCTDVTFLYSDLYSVVVHAKYLKQNSYIYTFSYKGTESFGKFYYGAESSFGAAHGDDLIYLFNSDQLFPGQQFTETEKIISDSLITLWANFATFGCPTPADNSWSPFRSDRNNFYIIGNHYRGEVEQALPEAKLRSKPKPCMLSGNYNSVSIYDLEPEDPKFVVYLTSDQIEDIFPKNL